MTPLEQAQMNVVAESQPFSVCDPTHVVATDKGFQH